MFLTRWVTQLVSLPLFWLGQAGSMFKFPPALLLLRAGYAISGNQVQGLAALANMLKIEGLPAASAQARTWAQRRPGPEVTAFAGLLAVDSGDMGAAKAFHAQSVSYGLDTTGMQEMLEFHLTFRGGDAQARSQFIQRLKDRHDLSALLSRLLQNVLASWEMEQGRFDAARALAQKTLAIEDSPDAHILLWALDTRAGNHADARKHLGRADLPPARKLGMQAAAIADAGDKALARQLLDQLRQYDAAHADRLQAAIDAQGQTPSQPPAGQQEARA